MNDIEAAPALPRETERSQLDALVEAYGAAAYLVAAAMLGEGDRAEEAVAQGLNEAALRLAETRGLLDGGELAVRFTRLRALELLHEGRMPARKQRRRERRALAAREVDIWGATTPGPPSVAAGAVLERMRSTQRLALQLAFMRGKRPAEIARETGSSDEAVRARLRSALLEIQEAADAAEFGS
jgi:hypothetical protein